MEFYLTIGAMIAGISLVAGMIMLERRPREDFKPRLVPTTPLMFAGVLIVIMAVVHLMTLNGISLPSRR